jgi:hypothetical protein
MNPQKSAKGQDSAAKSPVADNLPAKYQKALQCNDIEERCRYLKEAAEAGYIPAMCGYGLMCHDECCPPLVQGTST